MKKKAEHIALIGLLGALALVLGILENLLPPLPACRRAQKPGFQTLSPCSPPRYRPARGAVHCGNQGSVCVFDARCFRRADEPLRRTFEHAHHGHTVEKNKIHAGLHRCLRCVRAQPRTAARRVMDDRLRRAGVYSRARAVFGRLRHLHRAFAAGFTPAVGEATGFEEIIL